MHPKSQLLIKKHRFGEVFYIEKVISFDCFSCIILKKKVLLDCFLSPHNRQLKLNIGVHFKRDLIFIKNG